MGNITVYKPVNPDTGITRHLPCVLLCVLLGACTSTLPRTETIQGSPWQTFEEAKAAFELITIHETTREDLHCIGYDPFNMPNIEIVNYLGVIRRFMPNNSISLQELHPDVRTCIEARDRCMAYEARPSSITEQRTGNLVSDSLNFSRRTTRTGWIFEALILIHDDTVVYKLWSGKPKLDETSTGRNPLGPLQDGGLVRDALMP